MTSKFHSLPETTIEGHKYDCQIWNVSKTLIWHKRFLDLGVGPLLGFLGSTKISSLLERDIDGETQIDFEKLAPQITDTLFKLDPETYVAYVRELLEDVAEDGKAINFEVTFQGRTLQLYKVVGWVIKTQCSDFLSVGSGKKDSA